MNKKKVIKFEEELGESLLGHDDQKNDSKREVRDSDSFFSKVPSNLKSDDDEYG